MRVTVVGAGVIGLTAARELAAHGHRVTMLADEAPEATTSAVAAASCKPRMVPADARTRALLGLSLAGLEADPDLRDVLAASPLVHVEAGTEPLPRPWYLDAMGDVRELVAPAPELVGPLTHGFAYRTMLFDVPVAVDRLVRDLARRGVRLRAARVADLDPARDRAIAATEPAVVVNATGIRAGALVADDGLQPVRGDVVLVDRAGIDLPASLSAIGSYLYPRREHLVVGGTAVRGDSGRTPDGAVVADLLARAARLVPAVATAPVARVLVGTRPHRPAGVRCDVDTAQSTPVVHAFGHGGAGWTLAVGTARWVAHAVSGLAAGDVPAGPEALSG